MITYMKLTRRSQKNTKQNTLPPLSVLYHNTVLCSVLLCSVPQPNYTTPPTMDCWYSSMPMDDEFEKLVIRMNPPRSHNSHHSQPYLCVSLLCFHVKKNHCFAFCFVLFLFLN